MDRYKIAFQLVFIMDGVAVSLSEPVLLGDLQYLDLWASFWARDLEQTVSGLVGLVCGPRTNDFYTGSPPPNAAFAFRLATFIDHCIGEMARSPSNRQFTARSRSGRQLTVAKRPQVHGTVPKRPQVDDFPRRVPPSQPEVSAVGAKPQP